MYRDILIRMRSMVDGRWSKVWPPHVFDLIRFDSHGVSVKYSIRPMELHLSVRIHLRTQLSNGWSCMHPGSHLHGTRRVIAHAQAPNPTSELLRRARMPSRIPPATPQGAGRQPNSPAASTLSVVTTRAPLTQLPWPEARGTERMAAVLMLTLTHALDLDGFPLEVGVRILARERIFGDSLSG